MSQTFARIQNILNVEFQEPLADLVNRHNPVLAAIEKRGVASQAIYLKARTDSDHEAGPVVDGAEITVTDPNTSYIAPTLPWATYKATFSVPKRAMDQAAANPGEIGALLMSEVMEAAKDLSSKIASDLFAGAVSNGLVGLQAIVDNANTYAGVNRATSGNENWRSVVIDHSTVTPDPPDPDVITPDELSTAVLYELEELFFDANGYGWNEMPGLFTGVTSSKVLSRYKALMEDIDLAAISSAHFVNQANTSGQLGIGSTGFMGVPFLRDRNVSSSSTDEADTSRLYFLDMSKIALCVLNPGPNAAIHQTLGFEAAPVVDGIRTQVEILGNRGEFVAGYVKAYVQLATSNPKAAGAVIKNISIA